MEEPKLDKRSQITVYIEPSLKKRLRLYCVRCNTTIYEYLDKLIKRDLDEHEEAQKWETETWTSTQE